MLPYFTSEVQEPSTEQDAGCLLIDRFGDDTTTPQPDADSAPSEPEAVLESMAD